HGSGNIGATNVGRLLGRRFGVLVFLLDFAKGALPVLVATRWLPGADVGPDVLGVTAGVAAFLGHLFPVYLHFRGGKGVAPAAGRLRPGAAERQVPRAAAAGAGFARRRSRGRPAVPVVLRRAGGLRPAGAGDGPGLGLDPARPGPHRPRRRPGARTAGSRRR